MSILEEFGDFTKIGDNLFFVETRQGNFVWDATKNILTPESRGYYKYMADKVITKVKYRGKHKLIDYCDTDVTIESRDDRPH